MTNDSDDQSGIPVSRSDKLTEEIIETAVTMVMQEGRAAAAAYLRSQGISTWTSLRVLQADPSIRRKRR